MKRILYRATSVVIVLSIMLSDISVLGTIPVSAKALPQNANNSPVLQETLEPTAEIPAVTDVPLLPEATALPVEPSATPEATGTEIVPTLTEQVQPTDTPSVQEPQVTVTNIPAATSTLPIASSTMAAPFSDCSSVTEIPATECQALTTLFDSTGDFFWGNKTDWKATNTPCSWYGITCTSGHVTGISLPNNNLDGYLTDQLGNLTNLTTLDVHGNSHLVGFLPLTLTQLTHISTLDYSGTGLCERADASFQNWLGQITTLSRSTECKVNGNISGKVTDASTSSPISGVQVCVRNFGSDSNDKGCFPTGSDGSYTATDIPAGNYWVVVEHPGYARQFYNNATRRSEAATVVVNAVATTTDINFALQTGGTISGTVFESNGTTPLANMNVVLDTGESNGGMAACTDSSGNFSFPSVPFGIAYYVVAAPTTNWCSGGSSAYNTQFWDHKVSGDQAATIQLSSSIPNVSGVNFSLGHQGGTISGTVTSVADHAPLTNIKVCIDVYDSSQNVGCFDTDSEGNYTSSVLAPNDYRLSVTNASGWSWQFYNNKISSNQAERVTVHSGESTTGINFALVPGGTISGRIMQPDGVTPAANLNISLEGNGNGNGTCTDANGNYTFATVPFDEDYRVHVAPASETNWCQNNAANEYPEQYYDNTTDQNSAHVFRLTASSSTASDINFVMQAGGKISGVVTSAADHTPLANISVCIFGYDNGQYFGCYNTDSEGKYLSSIVPPNDYQVYIDRVAGWSWQYYNNKVSDRNTDRVTVQAGETKTGIDFALNPSGTISGRAMQPDGVTPAANLNISLDGDGFSSGVCTDANGYYSNASVPLDVDFVVHAAPANSPNFCQNNAAGVYAEQYFENTTDRNSAHVFHLTASSSTASDVNFVMQAGGKISGTVKSAADNTPLANISVCIDSYDSGQNVGCFNTDNEGKYTSSILTPNDYRVNVNNAAGWSWQYYNNKISDKDAARVTVHIGETTDSINFALVPGGTISGRALQPDGVTPAANLNISLQGNGYGNGTCTDSNGYYTFASVPLESDFRVSAAPSDFTNWCQNNAANEYAQQYFDNATDWNSAHVFHLTASSSTAIDVNFVMQVGGKISGKVTKASDNTPIANSLICIAGYTNDTNFGCYTTGSDGIYSTGILPEGTYRVNSVQDGYELQYFSTSGNSYTYSNASPVSVSKDTTTENINFNLAVAGTIRGKVTDTLGNPLANINLNASTRDGSFSDGTCTDSNGNYYMSKIPMGLPVNISAALTWNNCDNGPKGVYGEQFWNGSMDRQGATTVTLSASQPLIENANFSLSGAAHISGRVVDQANKPIENAFVMLREHNTERGLESFKTTDANGEYFLDSVPAGTYDVVSFKKDYTLINYDGNTSRDSNNPITVTAGQSITGINFVLPPGGTVTGKVFASDGVTPLKDIQVWIGDAETGTGDAICTDSTGTYKSEVIPLNSNLFVVANPNGRINFCSDSPDRPSQSYYPSAAAKSGATTVQLTTGGQVLSGINIIMQPVLAVNGKVSGTVRRASDNSPLANLQVCIFPVAGGNDTCVNSASDGTYTVENLTPGEYRARIIQSGWAVQNNGGTMDESKAPKLNVKAGETISGIDFALIPGGTVTGRVLKADGITPIPNLNISFSFNGTGAGACTDANGYYSFGSLPLNTEFNVIAAQREINNFCQNNAPNEYVQQYWQNVSEGSEATSLTLTSSSPSIGNINFSMEKGGTISGQVTKAADHAPLANISVCIDLYDSGRPVGCFNTDSEGKYTSPVLTTADYRINVNNAGWVWQYYNNKLSDRDAERVAVHTGESTTGINFVLYPAGTISGRVFQPDGVTPAANLNLSLESDRDGYGGTCTDENGYYSFTSAPLDEDIRVHAAPDIKNWCQYDENNQNVDNVYAPQYYDNVSDSNLAHVFHLTASSSTASDVNFVMHEGGRISGTVKSAVDNTPLANISVCVDLYGTRQNINCFNTDSEGKYTSSVMAPADYRINVNNDGWGWQYYNNKVSDSDAERVTVRTGETTTGIDFTLNPGGTISGRVMQPDGVTPAANLNISLQGNGFGNGTCTDANGYYSFAAVPLNEDFRLRAAPANDTNWCQYHSANVYAEQYYDNTSDSNSAHVFHLTSSSSTASDVDFVMHEGGQISGKVTSAVNNSPIENVNVCFSDYSDHTDYGCAVSASDGTYTSNILPGKNYRVMVKQTGYSLQYYNNANYYDAASPVSVTAGSVTGHIDFPVYPAGSIRGKVTDSQGNPIAGINVEISSEDISLYDSVCSDSNGNYSYDFAPTGLKLKVAAAKGENGCENGPKNVYAEQYWNNSKTFQEGEFITLSEGQSVAENINFSLSKSGSISGTVKDVNGNPIAKANVRFILKSIFDKGPFTRLGSYTETDSQGTFLSGTIPPGTYTIVVYKDGFTPGLYNNASNWVDVTPVTIASGQSITGLNFVLVSGGSVSGKVFDADGTTPLADIPVWIGDIDSGIGDFTCTDESGAYSNSAIPLNTDIRVLAEPDGYTNWCTNQPNTYPQRYYGDSFSKDGATVLKLTTSGQVVSGANITLKPESAMFGTITGTVRKASDNSPISNLQVCIVPLAGGNDRCFNTGADGTYTTKNLTPGDYHARIIQPGWAIQYNGGALDGSTSPKLTVKLGETISGVNFTLTPGGTLSGKVLKADGITPISNMNIGLDGDGFSEGACTDSNGNYTFESIPLNTGFKVAAAENGIPNYCQDNKTNEYVQQYWQNAKEYPEGTLLTLTADSPSAANINFSLSTGGFITGKVTAAAGSTPLSGIDVCFEKYDDGSSTRCVSTGSDGTYTSMALPEDDYRAKIYQSGYAWQYYPNTFLDQNASRISVKGGKTSTNIDFALAAGGTISGRVLAPDGVTPIENMNVNFGFDGYGAGACTDANGNYSFANIPLNADVRVAVAVNNGTNWCKGGAPNEYPQQFWNNAGDWNSATVINLTGSSSTADNINFVMKNGGKINGKVTSSSDGSAIENVDVCFETYDSNNRIGCVTTASDGTYSSSVLPSTDIRVSVFASTWVKQYYNNTKDQNSAARVTVTEGHETNDIDFALIPGGLISGTVISNNGSTPLQNVTVVLDAPDISIPVCTDAQGKYTFDYIPAGVDFKLRAAPGNWENFCGPDTVKSYAEQYWNNASTKDTATVINLTEHQKLTGTNFTLVPGGVVKGHVTDKVSGTSLANIRVALANDNNESLQIACTDSNGNYEIDGARLNTPWRVVAAPTNDYCNGNVHSYYHQFWKNVDTGADATTVTLSSTTPKVENINFSLTMGGKISGTVTDKASGNVLSNIGVCFEAFGSHQSMDCVSSDSNGAYVSQGLPEGDYRVTISHPGYAFTYYDGKIYDTATPVSVTAGATTSGIDFKLAPGGTISGRVLDNTGNPVGSINVDISNGLYWTGACTDANGYYTINSVPYLDILRVVAGLGKNYCQGYVNSTYGEQYWKNANTKDDATTIQLSNSSPKAEDINFTLTPGGSISGIVTDKSGKPVLAGIAIRMHGTKKFLEDSIMSGTDGRYTYEGVQAGTYDVVAGMPGYATTLYNNALNVNDATPVKVTAGGKVTGINFVLTQGGTITGKVVDTDGITPLANMPVKVTNPATLIGDGVCTDVNGIYTSAMVPLNTDMEVVVAPTGENNWCTGAPITYPQRFWNDANDEASATPIRLTAAGQVVSGIDITMHPAGELSGTVHKGSDNSPISDVDVCLYSFTSDVKAGCFKTDSSGEFVADNIPSGDYRVLVDMPGWALTYYGNTSLKNAATKVTVLPGMPADSIDILLNPGGKVTGRVLQLDGTTAIPNMNVEVDWGTGGVSKACSDANGNYELANIPLDTPFYAVTARTANWCSGGPTMYTTQYWQNSTAIDSATSLTLTSGSSEIGDINFTMGTDSTPPAVPELVSPISGTSVNSTVEFKWNADTDAALYQFQYDNNSDFSSPVISVTQTSASYTPVSMSVGKYYWRVKARDLTGNWSDYSNSRILYVNPAAPALNTPADLASVLGTPSFVWTVATGAAAYQFEYDNDADFSSPVYTSAVLTTNSITPPLMKAGTYYWHVKARDTYGNWGVWSTARTITILAPASPVLASPADNADNIRAIPTFTWVISTGATAYQWQYTNATDSAFSSPILTTPGLNSTMTGTPLTVTSYKPASMALMTDFLWRVRAQDSAGNWGSWSNAWHIRILPVVPAFAPVLTTPAANLVTNNTKPAFVWGSVANATNYDIELDTTSAFTSANKIAANVNVLTYTVPGSLTTDGAWYWHVRAKNANSDPGPWSATQSFTLDTTGPNAPALSLPVDSDPNLRAIPTFSWAASSGANAYQFQYDDDFSDPILFSTPGDTVSGTPITTTSYKPANMVLLTDYQWRVRARDVVGNWGPWSDVRHVKILPVLITTAPVMSLPAANLVTSNTKPVFTWTAVTNAAGYDIEIDNVNTFDGLKKISDKLTALTYTPALDLSGDGTWYWRVRARNTNNEPGPWAVARTFTLDTTGPDAPVLSTPIDSAPNLRTTPTFTWAASSGANAYQFQYDDDFVEPILFSTPGDTVSGTPITTTSYKPSSMALLTDYQWRVRARDAIGNWGPWSVVRHIQILPSLITSAPVLNLPAANALVSNTKPVFTWGTVTNATGFDIEIDTVSTFDSAKKVVGDVDSPAFTPSAELVGDGTWYWHVRAKNANDDLGAWSTARTFTLDTTAPDAPALIAPLETTTLRAIPTFTWAAVTGANAYQFQYYDDMSDPTLFSTPGDTVPGTPITTTSYKPTGMVTMSMYFWRVRARDAAGNWGEWSNIRSVQILPLLVTAAPVQNLPATNFLTADTTPTFTWTAAVNATNYDIEIDKASTFDSTSKVVANVSALTYTPTDKLVGDGTWYWHIRGKNANNEPGPWSAARTFTLDTTVPDAPALTAPVDNAENLRAIPTFTWAAVTGANAYQFQYDDDFADPILFSTPGDTVSGTPISTTSYKPTGMVTLNTYQWRVRARDAVGNWGAWSEIRNVQILPLQVTAVPVQSLPAANYLTADTTPTFTWAAAVNATNYDIEIDRVSTFDSASKVVANVTALTYTSEDTLVGDGTWYWHVRGKNANNEPGPWSAARTFTLDTTVPDAPALTAPVDNAANLRAIPTFTWAAVTGANAYQFQYDDDFVDPILFSTPGDTISGTPITTTSYKPTGMVTLNTYQWRVRARDAAGNWGAWSEIRNVQILPLLVTAAPVQSLPAANYLTADTTPTFTWTAAVNATNYDIEIDKASTFDSAVKVVANVPALTYTAVDALPEDGTWYWHVRGKNANNEPGPWSAARTFTLDTTAPDAPALTAPVDNAANLRAIPTFTWAAVTGANAYQFQYDDDFVDPILFSTPGDTVPGTPITTTSYKPTGMVTMSMYFWRVRARDAAGNWGAWSEIRNVQILPLLVTAAPVQSLPAANFLTANTTPTFTWTAAVNATNYDIEIDRVSTFDSASKVVANVTALTYTSEDTLVGDGTWYWHIRGKNANNEPGPWSAARTFTLDTTVPDAPALTAPVDNAGNLRAIPTFTWVAVKGANAYQFQYDDDFSDPILFSTPGDTVSGTPITTTSYKPTGMVTLNTYQWRVRARDAAGNWGPWSEIRNVQILPLLVTATPVLSTPAVGYLTSNSTPSFTWTTVANAAKYDIEIDNVSTFTGINKVVGTISSLTFKVDSELPGDGVWYWHVRGENANDEPGPWSAARTFTLDTTAPDAPTLVSPVNNPVNIRAIPTFSWKAITGVNGYQWQYTTADDTDFHSPIFTTPGPDSTTSGSVLTTTTYRPATMATMVDYLWRVRARDTAGNWGAWSNVTDPRTITILPLVPTTAPVLSTPAANTVITSQTPDFKWTSAVNGATYDIEIDRVNTFTSSDKQASNVSGLQYTATPLTIDGAWFWRVRARNSNDEPGPWAAARSFTIDTVGPDAPELSLPIDTGLTKIVKPAFSWKASLTASRYQIQIANNEEFDSAFTSSELTTTSFTPTTALSEGTIYWRVRAKDTPGNWGDWSSAKTVIIDITPPNAPSLFSPESGWVTMKTTPFFMWFKPASAETYQFRYDNDANMSSPVHTSPVLTVTSYTVPQMAAGTYYWQVRAADKAGNWSAWSEIRTIQIDITPPPVPVLAGPANGYSSIYQVFTWNASSGAIGYQIQYDADATFASPIDYTADEPTTTHIPEKLIPSGKYYWRVRAVDEAGNWSNWSAARNFTVPE